MQVEIEGVGTAEFPDDAKPDEISAFVNKKYGRAHVSSLRPIGPKFGDEAAPEKENTTVNTQELLAQGNPRPDMDFSDAHLREKMGEKAWQEYQNVPHNPLDLLGVGLSTLGNLPVQAYRAMAGTPQIGVEKTDESGREVLVNEPKPLPFHFNEPVLKPRGTVLQPGGNPIEQLASSLTTPSMIASLPLGSAKPIQLAFLSQTAPAAVDAATKFVSPHLTPDERRQAAADLLLNAVITHGIARGLLPKTGEFHGPLATGKVLQMPPGATPPEMPQEAVLPRSQAAPAPADPAARPAPAPLAPSVPSVSSTPVEAPAPSLTAAELLARPRGSITPDEIATMPEAEYAKLFKDPNFRLTPDATHWALNNPDADISKLEQLRQAAVKKQAGDINAMDRSQWFGDAIHALKQDEVGRFNIATATGKKPSPVETPAPSKAGDQPASTAPAPAPAAGQPATPAPAEAETPQQKANRNQDHYARLQEAATAAYARVGDGNEHLVNSIVDNSGFKKWAANDGAESFEPKGLAAKVDKAIAKINAVKSAIKPPEPSVPSDSSVPSVPSAPVEAAPKASDRLQFLSVPETDPGEIKAKVQELQTTHDTLRAQQAQLQARIKELEKVVTYQTGPRYRRGTVKPSAPKKQLAEYKNAQAQWSQLGTAANAIDEQRRAISKPVEFHKLQQRVNNAKLPALTRLLARKELFNAQEGKMPAALGNIIRQETHRVILERYPDATYDELKKLEWPTERAASMGEIGDAWRLDPEMNLNAARVNEVKAATTEAWRNDVRRDFSESLEADLSAPVDELSRAKTDELIARIKKETETILAKRQVEAQAAAAAAKEMEQKFTTVIETDAVKSGKEAKDKLVGALETALEKAPEQAAGRATVSIKIPGDGTFKIVNVKEAIAHVLDEARKLDTSKGGRFQRIPVSSAKHSASNDAGRAVEVYGTRARAYQTLKQQVAMAKELDLSPEQTERLGEVVEVLENTIREKWQKARATLSHAEEREDFLIKEFGPKSKKVAENRKNIEEFKRGEAKEKAEMEKELGETPAAPPSAQPPGVVHAFGSRVAPTAAATPTVPIANTPPQLATLQHAMTPGLARSTVAGIQSLLLPTAKSPAHLRAAELLGSKLGAMNRRQESTAASLRGPSKVFDRLGVHNEKLPPDKNPGIQFMSDMSQGRAMQPQFQAIAATVQRLFQDRLDELEIAGAPLQSVRENYFPGMWTRESRNAFNAAMEAAHQQGIIKEGDDANTATPQQKAWVKAKVDEMLKAGTGSDADMLGYFTRSPLKGKESFRKQKVFDDIMTAAEFGLRPISANPIDLVKGKLAEMDKSIMANQFFRDLRARKQLSTISPYEQPPEGWVKLPDKYGTIYGGPTVTVPEHIDKAVYEGLEDFAAKLGVRHERSMKFPRGPGSRALGLSYQGQNLVRTRFATELSVLAHEIGHQIDYKYDLWGNITRGESGRERKSLIQKDLRAIADMTGNRGGNPRSKAEKIAQMVEAYVHAPDRMRSDAPTVFTLFDQFIRSKPELKGLTKIKPGIELTKLTGQKYVGLPIMGYRVVPKEVGDIVNNYLSSSLYNNQYTGPLYKAWMASANALNQSQLGLGSAFHAGFTTGDVQVSAGANLIKDAYGILRGNRSVSDIVDTGKQWVKAAIKTAVTGDKVLNAWRHPDGVIAPRIAQVVKATELAGGGYKMEHGLMTEQSTQLVRDWFSGHKIKAAMRSPIALTELMAKPIQEMLVPRQKAGVFAELAWRVIDQNPDKSLDELTPEFRQAWNRVDARLGQVRYNRLFANNVAKNLVQGMVRAPGWTGGTIAEIGGAFPDTYQFLKEWKDTGKLPANIPDRVAYTISLLTTVAVANAALTYAFTGQTPQGMDLLAFRTGRKDKNGNDERFLLPSYVKDMLAYATHPMKTIGAKTHPLLSLLNDAFVRNQDYYGYEIRNPHAGYPAQAGEIAKYVIKSFEPFWLRGESKMLESGASVPRLIAPYVGIMPAPASVTRSPLQNKIFELYHQRTGERVKPYDSQQADQDKRASRDASTVDVYMFKRLPQSDKDALRQEMTPEEIQRYFDGADTGAAPRPAWAR